MSVKEKNRTPIQLQSSEAAVRFRPELSENITINSGEVAETTMTPRADPDAKTWSEALYIFCQDTSIHGLKQVTERQPFFLRRLLWLLLLLAGTSVFGVQMFQAIFFYITWPVSVNVKINYNDSILFPAVTICNQNAFRSTSAADKGWYYLITDMYGGGGNGSVDLSAYNATNLTLEEIHQTTAHRLEDLLLGCEWNTSPCTAFDFTRTQTDAGVCYTFNDFKEGVSAKKATKTGVAGGLRLSLNIEQYEYMAGPNDGAGLKIHLHEQGDLAMVKDLGLAIPSGNHAFVAVKRVEIQNQDPPHGKCDDSINLRYYSSYSKHKCAVNHLQQHVIAKCNCRDIYMSEEKVPSPVCNLSQYQSCFLPAVEKSRHTRHVCPVPCRKTLFEPFVSYASISNFDTDKLLRSQETGRLKERYVHAREITQLVNADIATRDTELIKALTRAMTHIDQFFNSTLSRLENVVHTLDSFTEECQYRTFFHLDRGLQNVKYILEHDFVRGWDIVDTRTLSHVAQNFHNEIESFERIINSVNSTIGMDSMPNREAVWVLLKNELSGRKQMAERAIDNITEVHHAYKTGRPLLIFKATYARHYDKSYIALNLLQAETERQDEYFDNIMHHLHGLVRATENLTTIGENFIYNNELNRTQLHIAQQNYANEAIAYHYRLFQFQERIVYKPVQLIDDIIEDFKRFNRSLQKSFKNVRLSLDQVWQSVFQTSAGIWTSVKTVASHAQAFREHNVTKTSLAELVTLEVMAQKVVALELFFSELRAKSASLEQSWLHLAAGFKDIWRAMLEEESTRKFYQKVHEHFVALTNYSRLSSGPIEQYNQLVRSFAYMLRVDGSLFPRLTERDIRMRTNADFPVMNTTEKLLEIEEIFRNLSGQTEITTFLGEKDEVFFELFAELTGMAKEYLEKNKLDSQFVRENFLRVDVFMQELSYEEIIQQEEYDIPRLLSDIGGSIGLFIGASVLSFFEFFDVIFFKCLNRRGGGRNTRH